MKFLRTPDERFESLEGYAFEPHYLHVSAADGTALRMHYVDESTTPDARTVLLLHGEPSWSYLYRKMIPGLVAQGYRVLAPDLVGFGRSDKPIERSDYSYASHLGWLTQWFDQMELSNVVLFCQDWGGLLGLRLLVDRAPRFSGVMAANTLLPTGDEAPNEGFLKWQEYSQTTPDLHIAGVIKGGTVEPLSDAVMRGYNAPYPDDSYKAGARQFPTLVPTTPDNPESENNRQAWRAFESLDIPFLTAFSDQDPVTEGLDKLFQAAVKGAKGQAHATTHGAGHFLQEDKGEELVERLLEFMRVNQLHAKI